MFIQDLKIEKYLIDNFFENNIVNKNILFHIISIYFHIYILIFVLYI